MVDVQRPIFIQLPEKQSPEEQGAPDMAEVTKEMRKVHAKVIPEPKCENMLSWRKLLRVTAYVFRFIHNVRTKLCRPSDQIMEILVHWMQRRSKS